MLQSRVLLLMFCFVFAVLQYDRVGIRLDELEQRIVAPLSLRGRPQVGHSRPAVEFASAFCACSVYLLLCVFQLTFCRPAAVLASAVSESTHASVAWLAHCSWYRPSSQVLFPTDFVARLQLTCRKPAFELASATNEPTHRVGDQ